MKIIKRNNKEWKTTTDCEWCGSVLEVTKEDLNPGAGGVPYVICPICGNKVPIYDDEIFKTVTKDNIVFPDDFYDFTNGKDIEPDGIQRWIEEAVDYFRDNPEGFGYETGTGNTHVAVFNYPDDREYHVIVAKGYYDVEIPYEIADIEAQEEIE